MSETIKTSAVLLCLVLSITAVKFMLYFFSGSIAVLSEAWHSFSDVATTLLVVLAIHHQRKKATGFQAHPPADMHRHPAASFSFKSVLRRVRSSNSELTISLLIGVILLFISASILLHAARTPLTDIANPLTTGMIFVGLSMASFFVCRFEATLAASQNSAALKADSLHNRADMVISLLTGISLILYYFGFNFDRMLSIAIALYILTFAVEMVVNAAVSIARGHHSLTSGYSFTAILWLVFDHRIYKQLFLKYKDRTGRSATSRHLLETSEYILKGCWRWGVRLVMIIMVAAYGRTLWFSVAADQEALLLRFGKIVNFGKPLPPGLHCKRPWPIDRVMYFNTRKIHEISVGNTARLNTPLIWNQEHGDNLMFISGDNNLFLPYIKIFYKLEDPYAYYFYFKGDDAEKLLEYTAYQSLIHLFARNSFYDVALFRREEWIHKAKAAIQSDLDDFKTGLEIVDMCIQDLHPPTPVAESYEDVVAASQVREKYKNNAAAYANYKQIRQRSDSLKACSNAQADVLQKVQTARGEALNYLLRLEGYRQKPTVMKRMMTLDAATTALTGKQKILVDPHSGISEKLIYMEHYMSKRLKK